MNTYPTEFYDLISRALGANDSEHLQGFVDDAIALKYGELQLDGFTFAPEMQLDFVYEQIVKEVSLTPMANYYDLDSPAIPIATEGAAAYTGKIPRMKAVEYWNEDKYRKMLISEERFGVADERVRNAAFKGLFVTVDTLVGQHTNSLTYQRHQMVSNRKVDINANNNPLGVAGISLSAHVPAKNVKNLTGTARWWTSVSDGVYATEGAACNPIKDLQDIVKNARNHGIRGHFEVQDAYLDQVLEHSKVKAAIAGYFTVNGATTVTGENVYLFSRENRISALGAIIGAPVKAIDSQVSAQKFNKTTGKIENNMIDAFEANVLVFVPDGNLGTVLTVEPLRIAGGTYASYYGGRLLLTVGADSVKKCQSFNTEMTSIVVPEKVNAMFYIHPYSAA